MDNFQPSTVKKLVQFIYTGDYDDPKDNRTGPLLIQAAPEDGPAYRAADAETAELPQIHSDSTSGEGSGTQEDPSDMLLGFQMSESNAVPFLLEHIRVNSIGDYYQVDNLVQLANSKIKQLLQSHSKDESWAANLPTAIEGAVELTGDKELLEILAEAAAVNIPTLLDTEEFKSLSVMTDFSIRLLQSCVQENQALMTELEETQRQLCAVENCFKAQDEQLRREKGCLQVLKRTSACRNANCSAQFECYIDPDECILRCARCRCKHYSVD
jgi:hypothetical protein